MKQDKPPFFDEDYAALVKRWRREDRRRAWLIALGLAGMAGFWVWLFIALRNGFFQ